jgi:micrococcal nuclease
MKLKRPFLKSISAVFIILIYLLLSCSHNKRSNNKEVLVLPGDTVGLIVKIVDGDTYDILVDRKTYRIRMNGIDAPERGQPFYQKAKDYLGSLCFQRNIKVVKIDLDRHDRTIAESLLDDSVNLSYEMVKAGFAWHYKQYSSDQNLADLENNARKNRLGLWADDNPKPPWEIRAHRRSGKKDSEE